MRLCLLDDLLAGAGVLATVAPADRHRLADRLLAQAHAADCYAKRLGRPHPRWGNGSLAARAMAESQALGGQKPGFDAISDMAAAICRFKARLF